MSSAPSIRAAVAPQRRLYWIAGLLAAAIVFAGFARTYYLKFAFDQAPLTPLVHLHGAIMTAWIALFVAQVCLVAGRRVAVHRRLGILGGALAAAVLGVGALTAVVAARLGKSPGPPPLVFLAVPLGDLVVFGGLVGAGLALRRRPDAHRRLMLLSTLGILPAAVARIPIEVIRSAGPLAFFGIADLIILACVAYDTVRHRRLHPAFGWGALFVVASHPLRLMLAGTDAWMRFAVWLTG